MPRLARYGPGARVYDVVSGERIVYRVGRVAGIDALRLSAGDVVLDLGCGTGLNLPLLLDEVGSTGMVIGVDRSAAMLQVAREKVARNGWDNVRLIEADVAELSWPDIRDAVAASPAQEDAQSPDPGASTAEASPSQAGAPSPDPGASTAEASPSQAGAPSPDPGASTAEAIAAPARVDAALATYAMSVFDDWHPAWRLMRSALAPGGRITIVDMARPVGLGALLTPLAVLACAVGGADLDAAPWRELEATGSDVSHSTYRSGHIHVVSGSYP